MEHGFHAIVSLSPERFVTIDSGRIVTSPIKGTRPRGRTVAEDNRFQRALMQSDKEKAELNMVTDLLRNDIGKVSVTGSVRVRAHRLLQKNPSVWHTYSLIEGRLRPDVSPFDAYLSMMPGGSVTGCPKVAAIRAIDESEKRKRGAYCGSMFMASDHGFFDSSILIRSIVAMRETFSLGVGGGIVADSVVSEEWDETLRKARPFLALSASERRSSVNGAIVTDDPRLRLLDPANPKSIGVFETMRVEGRRVLDLAGHLRRLQRSASLMGMSLPVSKTILNRWIKTMLGVENISHPVSRLKIVCTAEDTLMEVCPLDVDPLIYFGVSIMICRWSAVFRKQKFSPTTASGMRIARQSDKATTMHCFKTTQDA
jgi:para-aminobenzoate synthetase component 1